MGRRQRSRRRHRDGENAPAGSARHDSPAPSPPATISFRGEAASRRATGVCCVLILLVTAASFLPVVDHAFVDWDDQQVLVRNTHVRSLSPENLHWMLTTSHMAQWQPVGWLVFAIEYRLFDGADEAAFSRGIHLVSTILHAVASILCFFVLRRLLAFRTERPSQDRGTGVSPVLLHGPEARATTGLRIGARRTEPSTLALNLGAMIGALIFAVHPLRVESVAWATAQPYVLALIGCLAAVGCYLKASEGRRMRWLGLSWACFGVSLMCKPVGVPLVAVLLLLDWHPLRRFGGRDRRFGAGVRNVWMEKVPYAVLAACVVVIAPLAKGGAHSTLSLAAHGIAQRTAQACYGLVFYGWKTLLPLNLSPLYELRLPLDTMAPRYVLSALIVLSIVLGLILVRRRFKTGIVATASYAILAAPVLGFLQSGNQEVADRYSYLPCIAFAALIAAGMVRLWAQGRPPGWVRVVTVGVACAAVVGLSLLTRRQCGVWRDTTSLWTHAVTLQGDSSLAQNGYGYVLLQQGRYAEAVRHLREAIRIKPSNDMAHHNLWDALRRMGEDKAEELIEAYQDSIRVFPEMAQAHYNLGNALFERRDYAEAIACYRAALAKRPDYARAHGSLAGALYATGDAAGAIQHARRALALDPSLGSARLNLALALSTDGQTDEAIRQLREMLRHDPDHAKARQLLKRWTGP